ncbi:MAG: DUF4340 domain-containing protein [Oscillospiraceae bacterium]|nr:DUF4340 domain-containing protein [Oscillospiraceae bacterium]
MTKVYKKILIGLAAALILSAGSYAGVCVYKNAQDSKSQEIQDKLVLFTENESDVSGLKIHNDAGDYEFSLDGNSEWTMVTGDGITASNHTLCAIAATMCDLKADSIALENSQSASLSKYGLEDPLKITLIKNDSSQCTVMIGSKYKDKDLYYVMTEGRDEIFGVSTDYVNNLMAQKDDLKDSYLFDIDNSKTVNYLRYVKDGEVIYDINKDSEGSWQMTAPYDWATVNDANVSSLVSDLIRAKSLSFIEEEPEDLSVYGFDKPSYEIDIADETHSASFVFGNYYDDEKQFIYAYDNKSKQVSVFSTADVGCFESTTETILLDQIHTENLADVTGITFDLFGEHGKMDIDYEVSDFQNAVYKIDNETITTSDQKTQFESLFYAFTGIVFEKIDVNPDQEVLKKQPDIKIVFHSKKGDDYTLELFETPDDSKYFYAVANGEYLNVLVRRYVIENGIQSGYKQLKELF